MRIYTFVYKDPNPESSLEIDIEALNRGTLAVDDLQFAAGDNEQDMTVEFTVVDE